MRIACAVVHNDKLFYRVVESEKKLIVGGKKNADIQLEGTNTSFEALIKDASIDIVVFKGKKQTTLRTVFYMPIGIDEEQNLSVMFSPVIEEPKIIEVQKNGELYLGRKTGISQEGKSNDIIINQPFVSGYHLYFSNIGGVMYVFDKKSTNGLFLNGVKIDNAGLKDGDVLSIYTIQIKYSGGLLFFYNVGDSFIAGNNQILNKHNGNSDDIYIIPPRLEIDYEKGSFEIEKAPEPGGPPQLNWLSILIAPVIAIAASFVMVVVLGMNAGMFIMTGTMSVASAIIAVLNYHKQKNKHKDSSEAITKKYKEYLQDVKATLDTEHNKQMDSICYANPSVVDCVHSVLERERPLWERRPEHKDFMSVRVGTGNIPAAYYATSQRSKLKIEEKELDNEAADIADRSTVIHKAPVICDLLNNKLTGIIGERNAELLIARNIIIELATTHSDDVLKIVAIVPPTELHQWEWLRWLPHCNDGRSDNRSIITSDGYTPLLDEIEEELSKRFDDVENSNKSKEDDLIPHYLFIFAGQSWIEKRSIKKYILNPDFVGCSALFLYDQFKSLPKECSQIIEVSGENGALFRKENSQKKTEFSIEYSDLDMADSMARSLAPLLAGSSAASASLPNSVSFLRGYGVASPEELQIEQRWNNAQTYKSLSVPIAVSGGNDLFCFDIHAKQHGVHGIVGGMTGSGKTEMVQSWLLSLAVNFSPQDVTFVLIDFKGTGMIAPFKELPHLAGSISNLDTNINRNLLAIQNEVHRREAILDLYSKSGIKNINDLNKAYAHGSVPEKLPILLIVIDEYAEFKKRFHDFGVEIDSLISKGLALGMFVILMTQKPAGVVSPVQEDNIKFRWCLRVANYAASREMIGRPDAAKIKTPGRCFIKIGEDDIFAEVQALWSGAPYNPEGNDTSPEMIPISEVELNGNRIFCEHTKKKSEAETSDTEIDEIVRYINRYCKSHNIDSAQKVWTERLPDSFALNDIIENSFDGESWSENEYAVPVIGLVDDPANQRQYPLLLDMNKVGNTIVYGAPVTGKTTFLRTFITSLCLVRRPDEANVYVLDFGGWNLAVFKSFPHIGGVAFDNEEKKVYKLISLLMSILDQRKQEFAKKEVGNISSYRENYSVKIPDVFLVVDNLGTMLKMYPDAESAVITLVSSGANYGIYLVATATTANSVSWKITQNIKNTVALQMIDNNDYTGLVGRSKEGLPPVPGRGFLKGNPPLEFQTALPVRAENEKEINSVIRQTGARMAEKWTGALPEVIPEMPEVIPYGSIATQKVALGLSTESITPVIYDPEKQHYLLISGIEQSGKSNLLIAVAMQIKDAFGGELLFFDVNNKSGFACNLATHYFVDGHEIDDYIETLRPELQRRQTEKQTDPDICFTPIVFAIDDFSSFMDKVNDETVKRMHAIIKLGKGLGIYLIVTCDAYELSAVCSKGNSVALGLSKAKQSVMLGGCMNDHGSITVNNKIGYSARDERVNENEGFFVLNTDPVRFKAICFKRGDQ